MPSKYAPVLIPTLCRFEHFKECIESLSANPLAKYTDLFIALDYPLKKNHEEGYRLISEYLDKGIEGFSSVTVIKREKNYGATDNLIDAREQIFKTYDRYILTEDDNVFSPSFLDFMNKCLTMFEKDDSIFAINGYSCPIDWFDDGSNIVGTKYCYSGWGVGQWRNKNTAFEKEVTLKKYRSYCKNKEKVNELLKLFPRNFCYYIHTTLSRNYTTTDIVRQSYMFFTDRKCIMPRISLVRNKGWDGSGLHCVSGEKDIDMGYSVQKIEQANSFEIILEDDVVVEHEENLKPLNEFLPATDAFLKKNLRIWKMIRFFGPKIFFFFTDIAYIIYAAFKKIFKRKV